MQTGPVTLKVQNAAQAHAVAHAPSIQIKTHFWLAWGKVAVANEKVAVATRAMAEDTRDAGGDFAVHLEAELHASMIATAAVAHAIDATYGAIKPYVEVPQAIVDGWKAKRASRHARIRETFNIGYRMDNARRKRWRDDFGFVFGLRDAEVHHEERFSEPAPHPLGGGTSPENVAYSVESTVRALDLLCDVLDVFTNGGLAKPRLLQDYAEANRPAVLTQIILPAGREHA